MVLQTGDTFADLQLVVLLKSTLKKTRRVASGIGGKDLAVAEPSNRPAQESKAAEDQRFVDKAKRLPPDEVEDAEIEKAKRRTKARAPRIAMHIEDRVEEARTFYPHHSDDQGHKYRLADAFRTRSMHFVYSMLNEPRYGARLRDCEIALDQETAAQAAGTGAQDVPRIYRSGKSLRLGNAVSAESHRSQSASIGRPKSWTDDPSCAPGYR